MPFTTSTIDQVTKDQLTRMFAALQALAAGAKQLFNVRSNIKQGVSHDLWVQHRVCLPDLQAFAAGAKQQAAADPAPFATSIDNYYQTDAISRASSTMAKCVLSKANAAKAVA